MKCEEADAIWQRAVEGQATGTELVAIRQHVQGCKACHDKHTKTNERMRQMFESALRQQMNPEARATAPNAHNELTRKCKEHEAAIAKLIGDHEAKLHGGQPCESSRFLSVVSLAQALGLTSGDLAELGVWWLDHE